MRSVLSLSQGTLNRAVKNMVSCAFVVATVLVVGSVLKARAALSSPITRSVFVMRHCLRSTPMQIYGAPGFNDFQNYTSRPEPTWPVPAYQCLPQGIEVIRNFGKKLNASGTLPKGGVAVYADVSAKRDNDTAEALMDGLGLRDQTFLPAPYVFDPIACGLCTGVPLTEQVAALKKSFANKPPPATHTKRLAQLQAILGKGVAPALSDIPDAVHRNGYFTGGGSAASEIAEVFLMQQGSGMEFGWGLLSEADVDNFLEAHIWYRAVNDRVLPLVARKSSNMAAKVLSFLQRGQGDSSTLFLVGHDSDIDAMGELFGLTWHTDPFPANATTPGSALRFDLHDDGKTVSTSVLYQAFDGSPSPPSRRVPATLNWQKSGGDETTLQQLKDYVGPRLDHTCDPHRDGVL